MAPKRTFSLKIGLSFLIVALLPLVGISALSYFQIKRSTGNVIRESLANLCSEIGIEIERTVFAAHAHIQSLSENPIMKSAHATIEEKRLEVQKMHKLYKVFEDITLLNLEGLVIASTTYDDRGEWRYQEWFKKAGRGEATVSPIHAILDPFRLVIIVTAPVVGEDDIVHAVLAGRVNMERIWQITDRVKIGKTDFVFLTDKEGSLIAFPNKDRLLDKLEPENLREEILSGKRGTTEYVTDEGVNKICAYNVLQGYQTYKGRGWQIGIIQDTKEAYAPIHRMQAQILLVTVVGLVLIMILASLLSFKTVKPIKALAKAVERIAKGDINTQVIVRSKDEIGDLGNAFNEIAEDLRNTMASSEVLQESEKRFQDITTGTGEWIWEVDAQGRYTYTTPIVENVLGYRPEEVLGRYFYDFFHHNERYALKGVALELFAEKKRLKDFPNRNVSKTGETVVLETNAVPVLSKDGKLLGYKGSSRDITERTRAEGERKRLEAQLLQAQKMEAIRTLASSISHDFNNILQTVSGCVQLLLMKKKEDDPDRRYLNQIDKSVRKAVELTNQLLIFGGKVESKLSPIDLNREVMHAHGVLKRKIPQMINIELRLAEDLKTINGDPMQLEQIMINLGINAKDAMPDGGKLVFQTEGIILDTECSRTISAAKPGEYVVLTVSDTGHGMDKETVQHMFEPFYTTKGKGTGLSLAVVYKIIKNHGGYITCLSEPGRGTAFKIYFPALERAEVKQEPEQKKEGEIRGGHETILLVDDEEALLDLGYHVFGRYGYTTILAESGERAIEIYKREKDQINLVILDIGMPGMGGHRCLEELLRIDSEVKVIIASGYTGNAKLEEALEARSAGFIQKPYSLTDMLEKVRKVLDEG